MLLKEGGEDYEKCEKMKKITKSAAETKNFASVFAKKILKEGPGGKAIVLALKGDLGSGKTTFTQGFYKGLGLKAKAVSPTFIIMRRSKLHRQKNFKNVFHIDAYRISKETNLAPLGFREVFKDPKNIAVVEWPENIKKILPKNSIWINFLHRKKEDEREIKLNA